MALHELIKILRKEEKKRDFKHEKTPANSKLFKDRCGGTFEAVVTGNGQEKCLIPQVGSLHFLYRGQNQEFVPCVPSLYRGNPANSKLFKDRCGGTFEASADGFPNFYVTPLGVWHNTECLESGTVIFEAKDGAYEPLREEDVID